MWLWQVSTSWPSSSFCNSRPRTWLMNYKLGQYCLDRLQSSQIRKLIPIKLADARTLEGEGNRESIWGSTGKRVSPRLQIVTQILLDIAWLSKIRFVCIFPNKKESWKQCLKIASHEARGFFSYWLGPCLRLFLVERILILKSLTLLILGHFSPEVLWDFTSLLYFSVWIILSSLVN